MVQGALIYEPVHVQENKRIRFSQEEEELVRQGLEKFAGSDTIWKDILLWGRGELEHVPQVLPFSPPTALIRFAPCSYHASCERQCPYACASSTAADRCLLLHALLRVAPISCKALRHRYQGQGP